MVQDTRFKIIDSHCHPQFPQYDADREEVIKRALDAGVQMICVGTDLKMSRKAVALAHEHAGIWASVGLHPNDNLNEGYSQDEYKELAAHPKVVAIGEVGLDYYRTTEESKKKFQKERFEKQLQLAIEMKKPLIIHCRDAHDDMHELLGSYSKELSGGVIHSFTGTYDDAKRYLKLGFYLGFNGIITFTREYDETVKNIPVDKMLLETDAPYLTPLPNRGKRNEPAHIEFTARVIAELRRTDIDELLTKINENGKRLFSLK